MPKIASALGIDVSALFGNSRASSYRTQLEEAVAQFRRALELGPERIEINVYVRGADDQVDPTPPKGSTAEVFWGRSGEFQLGESVETAEFSASIADRATRRVLERLPSMSEEQWERLRAFIDELRQEKHGGEALK